MQTIRTIHRNHVLPSIILAGLLGQVAFEIYAWLVSPILFGFSLQPANLIIAIGAQLGAPVLPSAIAFTVHVAIGILGFGAFVYLVQIYLLSNPWLSGLLAGVVLWFIAQGVLAPFVGRSFMMGFGAYTQSSFIGHVGLALVIAHMLFHRSRRATARVR